MLLFFFSPLYSDPFFYVVIPSYNNENWCIKNLESIVSQKYPHWKAVIINDCSTDKTGLLLEEYVLKRNLSNRVRIVHNRKRKGMLANIYTWVNKADPQCVVATIDGDDWLSHDLVFSLLAKIYQNKQIWMTYGSWVSDPAGQRICNCAEFPLKIIKKNNFRKYTYVSSQLRTFYAGLFQKIKKKDLQHKGKFFTTAGDVAFMIPLLEMCQKGHFYFQKEPIYVYNVQNPINDFRINTLQRNIYDKKIRAKKRYKPLLTPPW